MRVDLEYGSGLKDIVADIVRMKNVTEQEQKKALKDIGDEIKKQVKNALPKSDVKHKHMRDDIKVSVKDAKSGVTGVVVYGGKDTGYKWHMLDDGTQNPNGTVHTKAIHFTSKAMQAATPTIDRIVDEITRKAAQS